MPIVGNTIHAGIISKASQLGLNGRDMVKLSGAIAKSIVSYIPTAATVTSTNVVLGPGAGSSSGVLIGLSAVAMSNFMVSKAQYSGLQGRDIRRLCFAISSGIVQGLRPASVVGFVIGGGPGSGVGTIIGVFQSTLQGVIIPIMASYGIVGKMASALAGAIAFGVYNHLLAVKVNMTNVGSFTPPPVGPIPIPAAPGTARVF